ncbi:MAG: hypothetical protein QF785_09950 [Phycisphaeraceae bacterium]|nr:hypothetical protein [Phycisphaeraceae bacterium]MDP7347115.1 hypothetical protein [Phycisphaeraceae bacterium]
MTATPIQSDLALWHSLRTRRRRTHETRGLDATANRWLARAQHARLSLAWLKREAQAVLALDGHWSKLSDAQLDEQVAQLRDAFACGRHKSEHVHAGLAAIREVAARTTGQKPYMVQCMGALGMFHGQIVEMATGEGKTLTASLVVTLLGWLRRPVHVITANDYLAQRDADDRQPIYRRCGLVAGSITGETPPNERAKVYRQPIVYTTQKELVADWLRDQIALGRLREPVATRWLLDDPRLKRGGAAPSVMVPGLHFAVVDELDAVLIDEAVTPLIIAAPRGDDSQAPLFERARDLAELLVENADYTINLIKRQCELTRQGAQRLRDLLSDQEHAIWQARRRREELVRQALVARHCYHHGVHYQIVEDQVMIVDESTGRFMPDRHWQHGLHQATEAKHHLQVTAENETLASLSFQRFFRKYPVLCGMTGTAIDAQAELETTYGTPVRAIPTNRPCRREILPDLIFTSAADKWHAIVQEVKDMHALGRPVLVGTRSIEASEHLSGMLTEHALEHEVLNAVHHNAEAKIIAGAGEHGAVTVATNMAGRGTDIKLGKGVAQVGGLHVILTERHSSRRIDRQLFGRSGRQGDPGSARSITSLEDELVLKYTPRLSAALRRRYATQTTPVPSWAKVVFDRAQQRAQRLAFRARAMTLRHEDHLDESLPV